jgi:hypothetical protein
VSARVLLLIALIWIGAVVLWSVGVPGFDFSIGLHGPRFVIGCLLQILTFGWVMPLGFGIYRLLRTR